MFRTKSGVPGRTFFSPVDGVACKEPFACGLEALLAEQRGRRLLKRSRVALGTQIHFKIDGWQNAQAVSRKGAGVYG